jgi:hypothetical protein
MIISVAALSLIHHSPMLMLTCCAGLFGAAAYAQNIMLSAGEIRILAERDEEDST